jgi:N-acyl-D-aspartate/D-glutamate deacylase
MQRLLGACLDAGAVGLSTSFVDVDEQFRPVPSRFAAPEELRALCAVLGDRGRVLQAVPEFWDATLCEQRIDALAELSLEFGIATTFSPLLHSRGAPEVAERILERVVQQSARGARVVPQVQTRPVDISFDLSERSMIFAGLPGWFELLSLPREAILARLREPDARRRLAAEARSRPLLMSMPLEFADVVVREVALDRNRALQGRSLGDIAAQRGCDPVEAMIDLSVEESLRTRLVCRNIGHDDPEAVGALLAHPLVQIGAGDGGAHQSRFSTYGDTSYLFAKYVRERPALSLEQAVRRLTGEICHTWGLGDRGLLHPGYAADVVVFDPDRIDRGEEVAVRDLPGGGARYLHRGVGVESVLVNGQLAWSASGGYTGACAGMIVTGGAPRG